MECVHRIVAASGLVLSLLLQLQYTVALSDLIILFTINSQLEGSLSQWTSYQEDVCQFVSWVERVEESLDPSDKQCPEMRDKTANLSKAKVQQSTQSYCIF